MSSQKYQPLKDTDPSELPQESSIYSSESANNVNEQESVPIIESYRSLSDSEDDDQEDTPQSSPQIEALGLQAHPLQNQNTIEIYQIPAPLANATDEEEKPEPIHPRAIGMGNDGVFANLAAKPTTGALRGGANSGSDQPPAFSSTGEDGETNPAGPLPDYDEAMQEPSPPHFDDAIAHATSLSGLQIDDLLVEGLPVGGLLSFAWNALVSQLFQFVGFLLTYLLHINHAGRLGSITGLGITLLSFGVKLRYKILNPDAVSARDDADDFSFVLGNRGDDVPNSAIWLAYMLMIVGWVIVLKSVTEYIRLRKERSAILHCPEAAITQ
ncbi:hypothetical protein DSO57_1006905 [Entomophthora muscae]|uniref:Uncharacterized protein n=1 Tax=Entomophthora muscae TaxID=34485 RepID=A0ACC2U5T6_9FUNG|nr:hypothetical protein DSO57_1006905 [Entomophthora muscae]